MDKAQIDILTQLPLVRSEGIGTTRKRGDEPQFDSHFRNASGNDLANSPTSTTGRRDARNSAHSNNRADSSSVSEPDRQDERDDHEYGSVTGTKESSSDELDEPDANEICAAVSPQPQRDIASDPAAAETANPESRVEATVERATKSGAKAAGAKKHGGHTQQLGSGSDAFSAAEATPADDLSAIPQAAADVAVSVEATQSAKPAEDEVAAAEGKSASELTTFAFAQDTAAESSQPSEVERPASKGNEKAIGNIDRKDADEPQGTELIEVSADAQLATTTPEASTPPTPNGSLSAAIETADESESRRKEPAVASMQSSAEIDVLGAVAPSTAISPAAVVPATAASTAGSASSVTSSSNSAAGGNAKPVAAVGEAKENAITAFTRLERNGLLGSRAAHRNGESRDVPHVDPAKFINRVARAIETAQERGTPLLLRLSPPELGSLRLELSVQQGALSATVEADNQNARQLLLDNLPALRDRLADQNIRIERFDVDLRRDGEGREQPSFQANHHREQPDDGGQRRPAATQTLKTPDAAVAVPTITARITNTSINVVA